MTRNAATYRTRPIPDEPFSCVNAREWRSADYGGAALPEGAACRREPESRRQAHMLQPLVQYIAALEAERPRTWCTNESRVVALRRGDHCSILEGDETQKIEEESVVKNNMDLLGWLRKQLAEAEPDLLREMVRTLRRGAHGRRGRRPLRRWLPRTLGRAREPPQRLPGAPLRHPRRHDPPGGAQAEERQLLPRLAPRAPPARRARPRRRGRRVLRARRHHAPRRRARARPSASRASPRARSRRWPRA